MKKKKQSKLLRRIVAMVMASLMVPTIVFAQTDISGAVGIKQGTTEGDTWKRNNPNGGWSSFDDQKNKALKVNKSYGFRLQATSKTKFSVSEGNKSSAPSTFQGTDLNLPSFLKNDYFWFKTENNTANNIQVKRTNLKIYQDGKWIDVDLVRTITGFEKYKSEEGWIALGKGISSTAYVGLEEVKTHNVFYKAGTNTPVKIKSNVTLKDIDESQYIAIKADKVVGQYVSSNTNLHYKEDNGTLVYADKTGTNYDSEAFTCVAFTFESTTFDYTFGRVRAEGPSNQEQYVGSGQNMFVVPPVPPTKTVSDEDETDVTKNTVRDLGKSWTYSVSQPISQGIPKNFYFNKFIFKDTIEECMKIVSVKVEAEDADAEITDVTSWFNISTAGNNVTATLKNPDASNFYDNTIYTLKVKAKMNVPENATAAQLETLRTKWTQHGHYNSEKKILTEKNKASTVIDEYNQLTNEVSTDIHLSTDDKNEPGLDITKDVNRYEHQVGDKVKYTVKVKNTNPKADTAYFTVSDTTLPDSMKLDFTSLKVSGIDAANYTLSQSGNGWLLKSKGDYALPYGTTITITYEATALVASNGTCVDNTASAIAAGIPSKEDKEQVYINSPKVDVEKTAPDRKYKVGDTVGYKVTITNRNPGTFMRDIVLSDLVRSPGLEIKEGSVAVLVGGKNVTNAMDVTYQDDGKGFDIKTPYNLKNGEIPCIGINPYHTITNWTDKIVVTYDATITDEAALESDLENIFKAPATENTNKDVIKDDPDVPSGGGESTEDVTMKAPALDITKKSDKQEYQVGDTGKYTLTVKQMKEETTAKNVVISDAFVQEDGLKIDASSIVTKMNKTDITKNCKITAGDKSFKIETGKDLTDEDEITVTYNVTFTEKGTYRNTATAQGENTEPKTDDNKVTVVLEKQDVTVKKDAADKEYKVGDLIPYKIQVALTKKGDVTKNVVIKDTIPKELKLQKDSVKVTGVKDYQIKTEKNVLMIQINKMTYGETAVVQYKAKILQSAEGKDVKNKVEVTGEDINPNNTSKTIHIPKPGEKPKAPKKEGSSSKIAKTMDAAKPWLFTGILIAAASIGVVIWRRKKNS